jgi:hypothetical protein
MKTKADRETLEHRAWAYCVTCAATWTHDWALAAGAEHARVHRHVVEAAYHASYIYRGGRS